MDTLIYYSPTGNTKHLAQILQSLLLIEDNNVFELEKTNPYEMPQSDSLILMYPIHGFNAPRTINRFLKKLPEGLYKRVHLLAVGCNDLWMNKAVSNSIKKILRKKKYQVIVDEIVVMPITIVVSMKEEVQSDILLNAEKHIRKIATQITNNTRSIRKIPLASKVIHIIGKIESPAARLFGLELHAKKGCTSCGICWNQCPEGNIKESKKGTPKFGLKCSMCMKCIYECPVAVITPYISKFIPIKGGYELKESIKKLQ